MLKAELYKALDELVAKLNLNCNGCGDSRGASNCCRGSDIVIDPYSEGDIPERFKRFSDSVAVMRKTVDYACIALDSSGRCEIYEARPVMCRLYPVKLEPVFVQGVYGAQFLTGEFSVVLDGCPGIRANLTPEQKGELTETVGGLVREIPGFLERITAVHPRVRSY